MQDEFITHFGWIANTLNQPLENFFKEGSREYAILTDFKNGWGKRDTAGLLSELTERHGAAAGAAVEKFLALNIARDWKAIGEKEAHAGTEIDDFIRVLWQPLAEGGEFDFTMERTGGRSCSASPAARYTNSPKRPGSANGCIIWPARRISTPRRRLIRRSDSPGQKR